MKHPIIIDLVLITQGSPPIWKARVTVDKLPLTMNVYLQSTDFFIDFTVTLTEYNNLFYLDKYSLNAKLTSVLNSIYLTFGYNS